MMEKMQFDKQWISWVIQCVLTVSYSLVINGKSNSCFSPSRGLRQGDPLCLYLFILVVDVLSRAIQAKVLSNDIRPLILTRHCPPLSHLLFADDFIFFFEANSQSC